MYIDNILNTIHEKRQDTQKSNSNSDKLKASLYEFLKHFWHLISSEDFVDNWHLKVICDILQKEGQRIKERKPKIYDGIVINVPPGSTKTSIVLIAYPAWEWAIDPSLKVISSSHSIGLSTKASIASRDIIESQEYKKLFPHVRIKSDFNTQKEYHTTKHGSRQATSPDSKITGDHGHQILYDDLVDPRDVESAAKLPSVISWLDRTISSREVNKLITSHIMIMQRLGIGDPAAHFIATRENVLHIKLPAVSEMTYINKDGKEELLKGDVRPAYLKCKYINGFLDPNRLPLSEILKKRKIMTPNDFNAQFMQDTETDTGKLFKKEYFKIIDPHSLPGSFWVDAVMYFFVDSAQTVKRENDPSGILVATLYNGVLHVVDYIKVNLAFSMLIETLRKVYTKHGTQQSIMFVEPKSNGKDIVDYFFVHTTFNVVEWNMLSGGKYERASVVEPSVRARGIVIHKGDWNDDFIRVITNFPDSSIIHDEEVDVLVMAVAEAYLEDRDFVRNVVSVNY